MKALSADERITRARSAQTAWAEIGMRERVRALTRLREQISLDRESIVDAIVSDTGKPALDALGGDVLVTLEMMHYYERRSERLLRPQRVQRSRLFFPRCRFTEYLEPRGVALIFGPANYPLQLSLVPAFTALYAGNAVVLKVSERAPAVAGMIEEIVTRAALPPDLLQVTTAGPEEAGALIDAKPDFIFFTGSSANGKAVAQRAAALGIPVLLELGGSDPAIVFADCDFDRAVEGIVYGAFSNAGQVCVGAKRLFVERPLYQGLLNALVHRVAQLQVGAGHEGDLGTLRTEAARAVVSSQVQDALSKGARLESAGDGADGMPIILSEVSPDARLAREECFGPVLCVQAFNTEREVIELANASPYALGASVWTRDLQKGRRVALRLNGGSCAVNDVIRNIANPHAAFGGNAASGYGRYHGVEGLRAFSRIKTVMENRSLRQSEINWFPLDRKKYEGLNKLIDLLHRPRGVLGALRRIIHFTAFAAALGSAVQAQAAHLLLQVKLPAGAHGRVAYLLFDSPNGFPQDKSKALKHGFSEPVGQSSLETIDLGDMPPGRYAASVYLDENENGKLDSGFLGIPKEPVGASNNPHHRMGPPRFEDCVFTMNSSNLSLSIQLVRP